jgi:predicted ester cyclase
VAAASRRDELEAFYRRYNACCNAHAFDRLDEFVAPGVRVDGEDRGLEGYIAALRATVDAFPDHRWDLRHLLVDGDRIAADFVDTGTHRGTFLGVPATGRSVMTEEFAIYRVQGGRIAEVWGTVDYLRLLEQLR